MPQGNKEAKCPYCGIEADGWASTERGQQAPNEGQPTVCVYCSELSVFNEDLTLRKPTEKDIQDYKEDGVMYQIRKVQDFIRSTSLYRPNKN